MISIITGISLVVLLILCLFLYYESEDRKAELEKETEEVVSKSNVFCRTKEQYYIIGIAGAVAILTLIVGQFGYHVDILHTLKWQVAVGLIIPIAYIDKKEFIIPNKLLLIGFVFTVIIYTVQCCMNSTYIFSILGNAIVGCLVGGGIFFIASIFVKNGVGAGDIKLFLWLGFLLSFRGVFNVLLYSMVISALTSIILIILKKKTFKDELPLAPFTLVGIMIAIFFGV